MTGVRIGFLTILLLLPITALSASKEYIAFSLPVLSAPKEYICDGKYKDGSKPTPEELKIILNDHKAWLESVRKNNDKRQANLCNANLSKANLSKADLSWADLNKADLSWADLSKANLISADLRKANLYMTNLVEANMIGADLSRAILMMTKLKNSVIISVDLKDAYYSPLSFPRNDNLFFIKNIHTVKFIVGMHTGLVLLRKGLKEAGLRELEREATYAIEKGKTKYTSFWLEKYSRLLFFEWTAGYGLYPKRCLIILLYLIPVFALIYMITVFRKKEPPPYNYLSGKSLPPKVSLRTSLRQDRSGIYKIWNDDRIRKNLGSDKPELITTGFIKSIGYAFYFSILSAFRIGWREINVGNWISRIQPREYTLRATGWVRTVSGIQSLISIYLLAFWVLTQFGRPFD